MKYPNVFLSVFLAVISSVHGDDLKIGRFDAKKVFENYDHTKDLRKEINAHINVSGPQTATPESEEYINLAKMKADLAALSDQIKRISVGTPEYERLKHEQEVLSLKVEIGDAAQLAKGTLRENQAQLKSRRIWDGIVKEISQEARLLASERGYLLIVPDGVGVDDNLSVIVNAKCDDLTEELTKRLNERYRIATVRK